MKRYEKPLFLYSLVVITLLLIFLAFATSKSILILSAVLLTPSAFYFWISSSGLANKDKHPSFAKGISTYIVSVLCISILISAIGINYFQDRLSEKFINDTKSLPDPSLEINKLKDELNSLKEELKNKDEEIASFGTGTTYEYVPPDEDERKVLGFIALTDSKDTANIFKESNNSSSIVGQIKEGSSIPYYEKQGNWYFIITDDLVSGWVYHLDVVEVTEPSPTPLP